MWWNAGTVWWWKEEGKDWSQRRGKFIKSFQSNAKFQPSSQEKGASGLLWNLEIFMGCYCVARKKQIRCEKTKKQITLIITLPVVVALRYPELYLDLSVHNNYWPIKIISKCSRLSEFHSKEICLFCMKQWNKIALIIITIMYYLAWFLYQMASLFLRNTQALHQTSNPRH